MGQGVQRFNDLRAWQACVVYKKAVYRLCKREPIARHWKRRSQLEDSVWMDFVDRGYITEQQRLELNRLAERALEEVTGLIEYLQSPEAARNAQRARERRISTRARRTKNPEPNPEPEHEPGTENKEPGTS